MVKGLVINRFSFAGIEIQTGGGNRIEGNFIGTDASGAQRRSNFFGVSVGAGNTVGGTSLEARNVISGNRGRGVASYSGFGNRIEGNIIGTGKDGISSLGNGGAGVYTEYGRGGNTVGGTTPGAANIIAFNSLDGVRIQDNPSSPGNSTGNRITGNSIFSNALLGIDLNADGRTNNDGRSDSERVQTICKTSRFWPPLRPPLRARRR